MSPPLRRYTLHTAAVLAVLGQEENRCWTVGEVADESALSYGSAYGILQRLWTQRCVGRQYIEGGFGLARLYYDLTDRGWAAMRQVVKFMPDPVNALHGLVVEDDDE